MTRPITEKTRIIREYLISSVRAGKRDVVPDACKVFGITRQSMMRHVKALVEDGHLEAQGSTRARTYSLGPVRDHVAEYALPDIDEFQIFSWDFGFVFEGLPSRIFEICEYGFTEMLNNAKDHSDGNMVEVGCWRTAQDIRIGIQDNGEGIFNRIARLIGLDHPRESLLELSKGKLTTDPANHSGEGIFFSSRAFDTYFILSGDLVFAHNHKDHPRNDYLLHSSKDELGTLVTMDIALNSTQELKLVFDEFTDQEHGFDRTIVPLKLALMEGSGNLVSRSQAKRILASIEKFKRVALDFEGVNAMQQGFADQVFRVFAQQHPDIKLAANNTNPEIEAMINRVQNTQR